MTYLFHLFVNIYPRQYFVGQICLHYYRLAVYTLTNRHLYMGMRDNSNDAPTGEISLLTDCINSLVHVDFAVAPVDRLISTDY